MERERAEHDVTKRKGSSGDEGDWATRRVGGPGEDELEGGVGGTGDGDGGGTIEPPED